MSDIDPKALRPAGGLDAVQDLFIRRCILNNIVLELLNIPLLVHRE
jgi:hypothetical protein